MPKKAEPRVPGNLLAMGGNYSFYQFFKLSILYERQTLL